MSLGLALLCAALNAQSLSVGSGGQASYGVPLSVPPGVGGMAPNLALSYADGGINGPVGVGWSVQGISTITRCPSSRVIDGLPSASKNRPTVQFDRYDRLCLDGQRLIATNEAGVVQPDGGIDASSVPAGTPYKEFRTEKDSFARVRAYGEAVAGNADAGPSFFKVWTKSGQLYEYGTAPGASSAQIPAQGTAMVAVWAVSRISDTLGNYMDFRYEVRTSNWGSGNTVQGAPGQEWNIKEVLYTGNASVSPVLVPQNKVVFEYDDRPDVSPAQPAADRSEAYQRGSKNLSIRRLRAVRTFINAAASPILVRSWAMDYEPSPLTGRSRLSRIRECVDAAHTTCLPATQFTYSNGASPQFSAYMGFSSTPLSNKPLTDPSGSRGTLTGDFNGDGKTDVLFWSNNPGENELYFSTGNANFAKQWSFNLTGASDRIFSQDGCYSAQVMDFNGDGRSDILRIVKSSCNTGQPSTVLISGGNGSFSAVAVNSAIDFAVSRVEVRQTSASCMLPYRAPVSPSQGEAAAGRAGAISAPSTATRGEGSDASVSSQSASAPGELSPTSSMSAMRAGNCYNVSYGAGKRFHIVDMNSDGLPDIVTTYFPPYTYNTGQGQPPNNAQRCSDWASFRGVNPGSCTRVFIAQVDGSFAEDRPGTHPNRLDVLYGDPPDTRPGTNPYWRRVSEADFDGDGLLDVSSRFSGYWRNRGDGSFEPGRLTETAATCALPIDFNGDQRGDCLGASNIAANQNLVVNGGAVGGTVARFNLNTAGNEFYAADGNQQTVGVLVEDLDGDGRQDILRWSTTTGNNGVYLSNGDGSFRGRLGAGLNTLPAPLLTTDGNRTFISGDFLGNGSLQLMQLNHVGSGMAGNTLLHLVGDRAPVDHLQRVTTGSGVVYDVNAREPLTTSSSYTSDRGTSYAATGNLVDLQPPSYVITGTTKRSPGFDPVSTLYSYHGLKAERNGRGMLGFRETRQQTRAPNGVEDITVATRNFLTHPYIGVASVTETFLGPLHLAGAQRLSRTTYSYCDKTSPSAPAAITSGGLAPAPCATNAKLQRPYLYESLEEGWDLSNPNLSLPSVRTTNAYNDWGDPTQISVVTSGSGPAGTETFTKTVINGYQAPITNDDRWILGRLETSSVRQTAPNSLASLPTAKGNAPRADQRDGNGPAPNQPPPPPAALSPAVLSAILSLLLED